MLDRTQALELLNANFTKDYLKKHSLATEAIMCSIAEKFGEDVEKWGLTGLLHDLDFEKTSNNSSSHGKVTVEMLEKEDVPNDVLTAIKEHNAEALGISRTSRLGIALAASETITGLIVATALVMPGKKLDEVKPSSVVKRMKKKDFARNVNRDIIYECEKIGIPLAEFAELSVYAMRGISDELGL